MFHTISISRKAVSLCIIFLSVSFRRSFAKAAAAGASSVARTFVVDVGRLRRHGRCRVNTRCCCRWKTCSHAFAAFWYEIANDCEPHTHLNSGSVLRRLCGALAPAPTFQAILLNNVQSWICARCSLTGSRSLANKLVRTSEKSLHNNGCSHSNARSWRCQ